MDDMGEFFCHICGLATTLIKVAIPRNPLHRLTCFHLLLYSSGQLKGSLSGEASAVLGIRAEVVIDVHLLTATRNSHFCKGAVPITLSLLV
jgi:hypothetical protein